MGLFGIFFSKIKLLYYRYLKGKIGILCLKHDKGWNVEKRIIDEEGGAFMHF